MSGLPDSSIAKKNKKDILRLHTDSGTTRLFLTSTQNKVCCVTHPSEDLVYTPRTCLLAIDLTIISIQICCSLFHSLFPKNEKSRPGRSSDFFKVLRSSRSLDVAYSDQKECKTILLKLQLRVQFRTRTGFPFQSIIHERMMNHL